MILLALMGSSDKLNARMKATESLMRLYASAKECEALYKKAGLPLPKEVALLSSFGEEESKAERQAEKPALISIPPPYPPMEKGWLSVELTQCLPTTVVRAVLRQAILSMPVAEVIAKLHELGVKVTEGAVANIGTRLDEDGIIKRDAEGWRLASGTSATQMIDGRLHGPVEAFEPADIANHRREAELAYLAEYSPISRSQLISLLQRSDWVMAPVNVFLVKADLQRLEAKKLIRRDKPDDPQNWDWVLVKKRGGGQLKLAK
jgi:hypothetical protein